MLALTASFVLAQVPGGSVGVYYAGQDDAVLQAVQRAEPYLVLVDRLELADVLVINDAPLDLPTLREIGRQVLEEEIGLVLFSGRLFPQGTGDLRALFGVGAFGMARGEMSSRSLVVNEELDPLQRAIAWESAPPVNARTVISNPNILLPIVETTLGEPVVQRVRGHEGLQAFVVGAWLSDESNAALRTWPYFDYLVYRLIAEAANAPRILSFAAYPLSPVPHDTLQVGLAVLGGSVVVFTAALFFLARRYLFLHHDLPGPLRDASAHDPGGWEEVGFQRPLSGFLFLVGLGLLAFIPLLGYRLFFLPRFLIPWLQALTFWEQVVRWLEVAGLLFDAGVGLAVVRYFTVLRLHNPREGFRYFQFYIWWKFLGGALQFGIVLILAALVFPQTALAHLSFYFVAYALVQFPGFLRVFGLLFRGLQRLDYEQLLTGVLALGTVLFQILFVVILRRIARLQGIDEAIWGVFGLGLGIYAAEWVTFLAGSFLYRRLGYRLDPLLVPDFDRQIAGRVLWFGLRILLGSLAAPVGTLLLLQVAGPWLPEGITGEWRWIFLLTGAYVPLELGLYNGLMPALAEAHVQGYKTLMRYYVSQAMRYGMWFSLFVVAVLGAAGTHLWVGFAGEGRASATMLVLPVLLYCALQWPAVTAERLLVAAGRPAIRSWLLTGEQGVRFALIALLAPSLQLPGIVLACLLALLLRGAAGWWLAGRLVVSPHLYLWQTVVVPAGAAVSLYALFNGVVQLLGEPSRASVIVLYGLVLVWVFPFYGFMAALLGAWNDSGLEELRQAIRLSGVASPLLWPFYQAVRLGAQISPLHGHFPVDLRELAQGEAHALTLRRPPLE